MVKGTNTDTIRWIPGTDKRLTVRGLPWFGEDKGSYRRLPDRLQSEVSEGVWGNSRCSSGARICFRTDSTELHVEVSVARASTMAHMPATGQSGVMLFEGEPYRLRPWGNAFPKAGQTSYSGVLFQNVPKRLRDFTLYLPLYNEVTEIRLGLTKGARVLKPAAPVLEKPVVIYGTSITMGGCAHTPEADFPSIVSRKLNLDMVNMGFSGSGRGEPEMARIVAGIDASAYIVDYAANSGGAAKWKKTLPVFVSILREANPDTPIILMNRTMGYGAHYSQGSWDAFEGIRDETIHLYSRLRKKGDTNLHFIDANALLPMCTELIHSDGGHPTSVGFQMMAERLAPQLESILLLRR